MLAMVNHAGYGLNHGFGQEQVEDDSHGNDNDGYRGHDLGLGAIGQSSKPNIGLCAIDQIEEPGTIYPQSRGCHDAAFRLRQGSECNDSGNGPSPVAAMM